MLIDNDVVIKLAQWDAYNDALAAVGVSHQNVGSLGVMLRYMGRYSEDKRTALTASKQEADRLHAVLCSIQELEPTDEERALALKLTRMAIEQNLSLDVGELSLLVLAVFRSNPLVATGDKKAIKSLPKLEQIDSSVSVVRGRILCLEQIMAALCKKHGFPKVRSAVLLARHADKTITMVYDHIQTQGQSAFLGLLAHVVQEQINAPAPGWLKSI